MAWTEIGLDDKEYAEVALNLRATYSSWEESNGIILGDVLGSFTAPSRVENMEITRKARMFQGQCHCGSLHVEYSTSLDIAAISPRACDCSFCQKHGAAYVSDASGTLRVVAREARALHLYRQGSELARFQLCGVCGVLVAVVFEHVSRVYGAVNVGCLDERAAFAAPVPASPQTLSAQDKVARWLQIWVPDVQVIKPAPN